MIRSKTGIVLLVLASLVLLTPVLIAPVPPITDYPNHLARMWLLSSDEAVASVSELYRVRFDTVTNILIDLIALSVGRLTDWQVAGRCSVALAVLLPPLGGALLWRSLFGRWHWWMLSFGLLAWGQSLLSAFLNFQIGIGLALVFAAIDPAVERRRPLAAVAIRSVLSIVLLLAHPFALLFYGILLAGQILGARIGLREYAYWRVVATRLSRAGISLLIVALIFYLAVPSLPGTQEHSGMATLLHEFGVGFDQAIASPGRKLFKLFVAVSAYSNKVDAVTLLAFALPVVLAAMLGRLTVHAGLLLAAVLLLCCFIVVPDYLLGAYWVDTRFSVMLPFALATALRPDLPVWPARLCATLLLITFVARTGMVAALWQDQQADVAALYDALSALPRGAALLPVEQRPADRSKAPPGRYTAIGESSYRHLASFALPWRSAFVPIIFAARGKQPIEVLPPWDEIAQPNGGQLADVHVLDPVQRSDVGFDNAPYAAQWRTRFNYVIVLNADMADRFGPFTPPPALTLVRDAGFAKLYRIAPPG